MQFRLHMCRYNLHTISNALVEQTVHRVRQMAMTLIYQLERVFRHSSWILNRFVPRGGQMSHFLIHGEEFKGKCCKIGEMVMAYVANDFKLKGTARWMPMIFAGISENKQYIVLHGKTMRLTRSIKRIFPDASQHLAAYQQVLVCEGVVGTRLKPSTAKFGFTKLVMILRIFLGSIFLMKHPFLCWHLLLV